MRTSPVAPPGLRSGWPARGPEAGPPRRTTASTASSGSASRPIRRWKARRAASSSLPPSRGPRISDCELSPRRGCRGPASASTATAQTGDNLLVASARPVARVLFPSYRLEPLDDGSYAAFRFRTYVGPGQVDPDSETLKIDYDSEENPRLLIRDILDELVQIVPGAYLGKVLLRRKETWSLLGYFALQPAAVAAPRDEQPVATRGEPVRRAGVTGA